MCPAAKFLFISGEFVLEINRQNLLQLKEGGGGCIGNGHTTCLVRTVVDDLVIIIGKFQVLLTKCPAADIWIAFGTGENLMYIQIKAIYLASSSRALALSNS